MNLTPIAHIENAFESKFGVPRQSGLAEVPSRIVFEPAYRNSEALRGIEGFDYLWLIWQFSEAQRSEWSPTVRPPRLGGNERMGVFATRSPFRPNALGLSAVRLTGIETSPSQGTTLLVSGADLVSGTPIYDIKPYLPYADSHPDARAGFAPEAPERLLKVQCADKTLETLPAHLRQPLLQLLTLDPRPQYHDDPARQYGMAFGGCDIHFTVSDGTLTITDIAPCHRK